MNQENFKVETIDKHIIKVKGELVKENKSKSKAPVWFSEWVNSDFNKKFKEIKNDLKDFKEEVGERFDNLVAKNNLNE